MGSICENEEALHCEGYDYEKFPDENIGALLFYLFSQRGQWRCSVDSMDSSSRVHRVLYPMIEDRLRLNRAIPNFYLISGYSNYSPGIVEYSLYTRPIARTADYHKQRMGMLEHTSVQYN